VKQELVAWDRIAAFYVEGVGFIDKNDVTVVAQPEPDQGGKVAVDEAGCECHRGQPKADVYACRYGGYHRRRSGGSLWHHPGDQAMVPRRTA
jgi:hypothetical protein